VALGQWCTSSFVADVPGAMSSGRAAHWTHNGSEIFLLKLKCSLSAPGAHIFGKTFKRSVLVGQCQIRLRSRSNQADMAVQKNNVFFFDVTMLLGQFEVVDTYQSFRIR